MKHRRTQNVLRKLLLPALCMVLIFACAPAAFAAEKSTGQLNINSYSAAIEDECLKLSLTGDSWYIQDEAISVRYIDGSEETFLLTVDSNGARLWTKGWGEIPGQSTSIKYTKGSKFTATLELSLSSLSKQLSSISIYGAETSAAELGLPEAAPDEPEATDPDAPVYEGTAPESDGQKPAGPMVYDGYFDDWQHYPHQALGYTEPGADGTPNAEGALLYDAASGTIYGHVRSEHRKFLNGLSGGEFIKAVHIQINGGPSDKKGRDFEWRVYTVDAAGNINWKPKTSKLSNGEYEYRLAWVSCWGNSKNINNPSQGDKNEIFYGTLHVSVKDNIEQCEFAIDAERLAAWYGVDKTELKLIEARFMEIGPQWISVAGASSGPWLGIGISLAAVAIVLLLRKRRKAK